MPKNLAVGMATSCWNELWMICALVATTAVVSGDADVTAPDVDVAATDVPSTGLPNAVTAAPDDREACGGGGIEVGGATVG